MKFYPSAHCPAAPTKAQPRRFRSPGDFAMTHSQWRITGQDASGKPIEFHHHGMEVHRKGADGTWYFFIDHPFRCELGRRASAADRLSDLDAVTAELVSSRRSRAKLSATGHASYPVAASC